MCPPAHDPPCGFVASPIRWAGGPRGQGGCSRLLQPPPQTCPESQRWATPNEVRGWYKRGRSLKYRTRVDDLDGGAQQASKPGKQARQASQAERRCHMLLACQSQRRETGSSGTCGEKPWGCWPACEVGVSRVAYAVFSDTALGDKSRGFAVRHQHATAVRREDEGQDVIHQSADSVQV